MYYKVKASNTATITSRLSNGGERVTLRTGVRPTDPALADSLDVISVRWDSTLPWPEMADNRGFSLVPVDATTAFDHDEEQNWRASTYRNGSPGADDPPPIVPGLLVSEVLANPDLGQSQVDFVEVYNPTDAPVLLDHWCLTDRLSNITQFQFPVGTGEIAPGAYRAVTDATLRFGLSSLGDRIYLISHDGTAPTGYVHGFIFDASAPGKSFGRVVNGVRREKFVPMATPTPGKENCEWGGGARRVALAHALALAAGIEPPVVYIAQIDYHPVAGIGMPCASEIECEFVRFENSLNADVALFDIDLDNEPWRVGGLNFTLPGGTTLGPKQSFYVTPAQPEAFRALKQLPAETLIIGPAVGTLNNAGEAITLYRPLALPPPTANNPTPERPYAVVDRVRYNDRPPWPQGADGTGDSLYRCDPAALADDASNWNIFTPCMAMTLPPTPRPPVIIGGPTPKPSAVSGPSAEVGGIDLTTILIIFGAVLVVVIIM